MTVNPKELKSYELRRIVDADKLRRIVEVLDADTSSFVELTRIAGLDPRTAFKGAVLRGVNFGTDDISGYDFSGADLSGADLSQALGKEKAVFDGTRGLSWRYDSEAAKRMIVAGRRPPSPWWPSIEKLDLSDLNKPLVIGHYGSEVVPVENVVSDLTSLAGLTALRELNLAYTRVSDLTPLAGLTALRYLNLASTRVSDLTPLSGLTGLQVLRLAHRPRDLEPLDLTPLAGLTGLKDLDIPDCKVTNVSILMHLGGLTIHGGPRKWRLLKRGRKT